METAGLKVLNTIDTLSVAGLGAGSADSIIAGVDCGCGAGMDRLPGASASPLPPKAPDVILYNTCCIYKFF